MRPIQLTLCLLLGAALVSLFFVSRLGADSPGAIALLASWLALPHLAMGLTLSALERRGKSLLPWCVLTMLVTAMGLFSIADAIYWHPDAQGAIGIILTPIYQAIGFGLLAPIAWRMTKNVPR